MQLRAQVHFLGHTGSGVGGMRARRGMAVKILGHPPAVSCGARAHYVIPIEQTEKLYFCIVLHHTTLYFTHTSCIGFLVSGVSQSSLGVISEMAVDDELQRSATTWKQPWVRPSQEAWTDVCRNAGSRLKHDA